MQLGKIQNKLIYYSSLLAGRNIYKKSIYYYLYTYNYMYIWYIFPGKPNIALGKSVSSVTGQTASLLVVDGFTSGNCFTISRRTNPWLAVDLVDYYDVEEIIIHSPSQSGGKFISTIFGWVIKHRH